MPDWTARLEELAAESGVPGAVLGIWADGKQTIAPYGVLNRGWSSRIGNIKSLVV